MTQEDPALGPQEDDRRISSEDLAGLVVDALHRAGIIRQPDIARALLIAEEEIEVRKAMGDY